MFKKIKNFLFENQSIKQKIAKNTFWLFFGQIIGRLLRAALIIFAARTLGPESWGAFSYATTFAAFLVTFSDIGISAIVTRESAKNISASSQYFSTAFFIKMIIVAASSLFLIFGGHYLTKIPEAQILMPFVAIVLIFDSLRNFGFALSRAFEKMQWEAINEIATNVFITAFGIWALISKPTSANLITAYIIGTAIGSLFIVILFRKYFVELLTQFNFRLIKPILSCSLPFAFASFLGAIMINTDLIMLGWMRTAEEVGFYSAAQKPIQFFYTLAALFATSIFPIMAKLAEKPKGEFKNLLEKMLSISLLISIPAAVGGIILGKEITLLIYGQKYLAAAAPFQILLLTLFVIPPSIIISNSLLACGQQKKFIAFSLIGALGNVAFNFLLIPFFGMAGCAFSTLITQIMANAFIWNKMKKISDFSIFNKIKKILLASLFMAAYLWAAKSFGTPLILNSLLALLVYFGSLKLLKEELVSIKK